MENKNDDSKIAGSITPKENVEENKESISNRPDDTISEQSVGDKVKQNLEALKQDFPQAKEVIERLEKLEHPEDIPEGAVQVDIGEIFTQIFANMQHIVNYLDYLQGYLHVMMPKLGINQAPLPFELFLKNNVHEKIQQKKNSRIVTLDGN